jgi:hypothetical protein
LLAGRTTFEGLANWPGIAGDPEAKPVLREISRRNDQIDKVVISDTLTRERAKPMFGGHAPASLRLIDARTFDGSSLVLLRYQVRNEGS